MRRASSHVLALLGLVSGLLTVSAPAQAGLTDPMSGAPAVGTCYDITTDELYQSAVTRDPVDCATRHTYVVTAVAQLPDGVDYAPKKASFGRLVMKTCYPSMNDALGTTTKERRLTDFFGAWFIPTRAQRDQGARWFECGLVMYGASKIVPIPQDLNIGDPPYPSSIARCLTSKGHATTCSRTHAYGKAVALRVKGSSYPTAKEWQRMGTRRCAGVVSHPNRGYRWTFGSKLAWHLDGDRYLVCFSRTS